MRAVDSRHLEQARDALGVDANTTTDPMSDERAVTNQPTNGLRRDPQLARDVINSEEVRCGPRVPIHVGVAVRFLTALIPAAHRRLRARGALASAAQRSQRSC